MGSIRTFTLRSSSPFARARLRAALLGLVVLVATVGAALPSSASTDVLTLTPETSVGFLNSSVTLTATLTNGGSPQADRSLATVLSGSTGAGSATCSNSCLTNSAGQVAVTWQAPAVGTDTLVVFIDADEDAEKDPGETSDSSTVTWYPGLAATSSVISAPPGGSASIEATLFGGADDDRLRFAVTSGPNLGATFTCTPSTCRTSGSIVTATYTSGSTPGTDVVTVYHDANNDGTRQTTESQKTLSILWSPPRNVLVYGPTGSESGLAESTPNINVTTWSAETWSTKTTADFGLFDAIVFGDQPACFGDTSSWEAAIANRSAWSAAVDGNVILLGTDPDWHLKSRLVHQAVLFAANQSGKTGLYAALSCAFDGASEPTNVELLGGLGTFTAVTSGCGNAAHKVSDHPVLADVDDEYLSHWGCSTHNGFGAWPASFAPLAMVTDAPTAPYTASDGTVGLVYMLARGAQALGLSLSPTSGSSAAGGTHTVTATYTDDGAPVSGARIRFSVTGGPNAGATGSCLPSTCLSSSAGEVSWTYSSNGTTGTDSIKGYVDLNNNGVHDTSEPQTTAAWSWVAAAQQADLWLTKSDSPDPVTVGSPLTYTVNVSNTGPDAAASVSVTDALPSGVSFVSATPTQGDCPAPVSGTLTCSLGTIASEGSAGVDIVVTPNSAGTLSNTASVSSSTTDPNASNNSDTEATSVITVTPGSSDLSITKTDIVDPVQLGQNIEYHIVAQNNGPEVATSVVVTDPIPSGTTLVSAESTHGSCTGTTTVSCSIGTLAVEEAAFITILVTPSAGGSITNTASIDGTQADPNSANDSDGETTDVIELTPGVKQFTTVANTDFVSAGYGGMRDGGSGTLTVAGVSGSVSKAYLYWHGPTNTTNSAANSIVTFNGSSLTGTQIGFSSDNCWSYTNSQAYRADVTSRVTGNGSYSLSNFVKDSGATNVNGASLLVFFQDGNLSNNRDVVLFDGNDSNISNLYDAAGWDVGLSGINYSSGAASLQLHVSDGQAFSDDALVLNSSELEAAGSVFEGNTTPAGSFDASGSLWDIRNFDITSFLTPGSNNVRLTTGQSSDCLSLVVAAANLPAGSAPSPTSANLGITKAAASADVQVGQNLTYTITVTNAGPNAANGVTVTDAISPSATFVSATPSVGSCEGTANVTCSLGTLANGASATVTLVVKAKEAGSLANTANVSSSTPDPVTGNNTATAVKTISEPPPPNLTVEDLIVTEGNTGTTSATFAVVLAPSSGSTVTANYATVNGTAAAGSDYTATSGLLTFSAGETSKTITVPVSGDTANEQDETFFVDLSSPTGANISDGHAIGTIENDDAPPAISIVDAGVEEGNSGTTPLQLNVNLSAASGETVTVDYATTNQTAMAPSDYAVRTGRLTFAPGDVQETITIDVVGDTANESNETLLVDLDAPSNATVSDGQAVGTITNDDPEPTLSVANAAGAEGGSLGFLVSLSAASGKTVGVSFGTSNGTATAPADYTARSGSLTFGAGETSKTVSVATIEDALDEFDETLTLALSSPSNAGISDGSGMGTIEDDDAPPSLSINNTSVIEGNTGTINAVLNLSLSGASGRSVTVDWDTADDTATAPADYTAASGTATFAPGDTSESITVVVKGDTVDESNERLSVELSGASGATIADGEGTVTILDDEGCGGHADFNGDGRCDLALGGPGENIGDIADAGAVNVLYGTTSGLSATADDVWHGNTTGDPEDYELLDPAEAGDRLGSALAWGDFNDDGYSDLALGIPSEDVGSVRNAGAISILYGASGGLTGLGDQHWTQNSGTILDAAEANDALGTSLAVADFNGDGYADLAAGAPGEAIGTLGAAGVVNVLLGSATGLTDAGNQLWSQNTAAVEDASEAGDRFGTSIATGDFDGDGDTDLGVGVQGEDMSGVVDAGALAVLYATASGLDATGDVLIHQNTTSVPDGNESGDLFGAQLASGDFNGDSVDDIAVTALSEDLSGVLHTGAVTVLRGSASGVGGTGSQLWHQNVTGIADTIEPSDQFGLALSSGDFDFDGDDELIVGARGEDLGSYADAGLVHVIKGSGAGLTATGSTTINQGTSTDAVLDVNEAGDFFGGSLAVGNFDGDATLELVVGAPGEDVGTINGAGQVTVFRSTTTGVTTTGNKLWHQNVSGVLGTNESGDQFGLSISS